MMLDFERDRLAEIGRMIGSDFKELRAQTQKDPQCPNIAARYSYMFGTLKVICAWLHDHLVAEVEAADKRANPTLDLAQEITVVNADDDCGTFLRGGM